MANTRTTEAFRLFYENVLKDSHNNPDLIGRWGADPSRFETQVNCFKNGTPIPDTNKFEEDGEVFGPLRWPYDAMSDNPNYSDPPIKFIVENRAKAIGTTWWDWKNQCSVGLGYDFDSLLDHNEDVGVDQSEIEKLDNIDVPWLEVVRSTRGNGRHVYIWFQEPYPITKNHNEHSALASAMIPLIARHTKLDIAQNVDCKGMVMWIWHRNATHENRGYELIKPATQILTADHVPPNWKDHIEVVSGSRTKVRVQGWTPDGTTKGDELDEMTQANAKVRLDDTHFDILERLDQTGHTSLWVHDHHLWQGHTGGLKQVFDDLKDEGKPLRGLFDTNSLDSDPGKPNCFMRPKPDGAWDVYRFGDGITEHPLWSTNGKWTHTTYNFPATLRQICMAAGGYEGTEAKQGYMFENLEDLRYALKLLKAGNTHIPDEAIGRGLSLHTQGKHTVLVIEKKRSDEKSMFPRYVKTSRGWETRLWDAIETPDEEIQDERIWSDLDNQLRALKLKGETTSFFDSWMLLDDDGWVRHPRENIKSFLVAQGHNKPDAILGTAIQKSWTLVNEPFQPEYPGGRMWNRDAAQFAFGPIELKEGESPKHPTWNRVIQHCGVELNEYIPTLDWCEKWGINTGGDYLLAWIACMFQNPFGKLPYLFMYGPQNSGKSSFHESVAMLLTKGVAKADRALTSESGFNSELANAILAVIDEVDVAKAGSLAYNKLKEWVTGLTISIHAKGKPVEDMLSCLHFVQVSNDRASLPVFTGDTRITAMCVPPLEVEIPKDELRRRLQEEAPHFMRTLMDFDIPPSSGRLMLPIIETAGKLEAAEQSMDALSAFIAEHCYEIPGAAIKLTDFKDRFFASLEDFQMGEWNNRLIQSRLSESFPVGRAAKLNQVVIGNLSFNPDAEEKAPYVKKGKRLVRGEEDE